MRDPDAYLRRRAELRELVARVCDALIQGSVLPRVHHGVDLFQPALSHKLVRELDVRGFRVHFQVATDHIRAVRKSTRPPPKSLIPTMYQLPKEGGSDE